MVFINLTRQVELYKSPPSSSVCNIFYCHLIFIYFMFTSGVKLSPLVLQPHTYESVSKNFRTESIMKYMLATIDTR
jgi:hypothetical protein